MMAEQRAALKAEADRNHRWRIIELVVMGVIVTIVSVAAQVGAAFIERGSLFPDKVSTPQPITKTPDPQAIAD